ncbi:Cof-type HAD-IIB family hydrolase [Aerococcus urinaeequi]|uniref:Cof-type HAD-IIB family hydrolase n=1 Tax=Aerococcus urinaeequi TaxID=51665 RepID=UPI003B3AB7B5
MKIERVAFFDIDGTLFDSSKYHLPIEQKVPESTYLAIEKLKANGVLPIIATGRWKNRAQDLGDLLKIDSFITSNGQAVHIENDLVYQNYIDQALVERTIDEMRSRDVPGFFDTKKGLHLLPNVFHAKDYGEPFKIVDDSEYPEHVLQMLVTTENIRIVSDWLTELKVVQTGPTHLDIYPFDVSKANGIDRVLEILNMDISQTYAFGDADNDLEMLAKVGTSVAMGNGTDNVKKTADIITSEVWNDGIYKACEQLGLFD